MPEVRKYETNAHRQAAYRKRSIQARADQLKARGLPPLPAIPTIPGLSRWRIALHHACANLQMVSDEMQSYYEKRLETWRESERGENFEERLEQINEIINSLKEINVQA